MMIDLMDIPRHRFTADDVTRMVEAGILREDDPLELIDGELIEVSPQGIRHGDILWNLQHRLAQAYGPENRVRGQLPLDVGDRSLPEPELAVLRGDAEQYRGAWPKGTDAVLVIEIAVTSHKLDRVKAAVYARGGVPVYWLLDVGGRRLECYQGPTPEGEYRVVTTLADTEEIALPGLAARWSVAEMLR